MRDHPENFYTLQCICHKLLLVDNKQTVETHKLLKQLEFSQNISWNSSYLMYKMSTTQRLAG